MGKTGNPARRAAEADPVVQQTAKVMRAAVELVGSMERAGVTGEVHLLARSAALGMMAAYATQTGLPDPRNAIKEIR